MGIVRKNSSYITIVSYIGVLIGYVNKLLLFPNFLTEEQVGLTNVMLSICVILAQFASLGSSNVILKFFPYFKNKEKQNNGLFSYILGVVLIGYTITAIILIAFKEPIMGKLDESGLIGTYFPYLLVLFFSLILYSFFSAYLRSLNKTVFSSIIIEVMIRLLVTVAISLYALNLIAFETFVIFFVLSYFAAAIILLGYIIKLKEFTLVFKISKLLRRYKKQILSYSIFSLLAGVSSIMVANIDSVMVAGMIDLKMAGIYTTVAALSTLILVPYRSTNKVSAPLIAEHWKKNNIKELGKLYKQVSINNLVFSSLLTILIWINIDSFFSFMPETYRLGKYPFLFLAIGRLFDSAAGVNGVILQTSKKYRWDIVFAVLLACLTVVFNYIFIPILGINGAALSSMLILISMNISRIYFVKHHFKIQPFSLNTIITTAIIAAMFILNHFLPRLNNIYLDFIYRTSIIVIVFALSIYFSKVSIEINKLVHIIFKKILLFIKLK